MPPHQASAAGRRAPRSRPDPAEVRDAKFGYGLEVILDGLALRLPPLTARAPADAHNIRAALSTVPGL